jgi:AmmeMemoRadiSam system protein A
MSIAREDQTLLLTLARDSIRHGLDTGRPLPVQPADYPEHLRQTAATFVTLQLSGQLRGCIGRLEAARPLVVDIAENAFAAAFHDRRFPPLSEPEWRVLDIHVSVLTPAEPVHVRSEEELLELIEIGRDGLIIEEQGQRATFLPSVWESLPDKRDFLRQLKLKAGLPADHWSPTLRAYRYRTESFS